MTAYRFGRSLTLVLVLGALSLPAVALAADTWTMPFPGVSRLHRVTTSPNQNINVLQVDLCAPGISVRATAYSERTRTVSSFGALVGAQAAINGDFSAGSGSTDGPAMNASSPWGGSDHGYVAPVQFGEFQVEMPAHEGTEGVAAWAREVVSGHPTLLASGERRGNNGDPLCTVRHPRTALGLTADRSTLFLVVVDGRDPSRVGMTCDELITLFEELGAVDAVNLDGGGSSTMWLAGSGVTNYPSDGSERARPNHLAVYATGNGEAAHCPTPPYQASVVALDSPEELTSGEEAPVWMEYRNDGSVTWDPAFTRLGTQDPEDRASAFFIESDWIDPSRPTATDQTTPPGSVGRFTWTLVAPEVTKTTTFVETFQPLQEGVTWFGPPQTMTIVVDPRCVGCECSPQRRR